MEWILKRYQGKEQPRLVQVCRCGAQHLDAVEALQNEVRAQMPDPELFLPDTREELAEMLGQQLVIGVWDGPRLAAYFILRYCGENEHNYACAMGLPKSDWHFWANADSVAVHPDYRGNGLQQRLMRLAEQWRKPSIIGIAGTISPQNPYSLNNALAGGSEIKARKEMYGGHDRYLVAKALLPLPGYYRHFKGKPYQVLGIARHSESQTPMVIYRALYGERETWVRPAEMWFEHIDRGDYHGPRFYWDETAREEA